jgi:hypothetical protein
MHAHATVSLGLGSQQCPAESSAHHRKIILAGFHNNNGDATLHTPQRIAYPWLLIIAYKFTTLLIGCDAASHPNKISVSIASSHISPFLPCYATPGSCVLQRIFKTIKANYQSKLSKQPQGNRTCSPSVELVRISTQDILKARIFSVGVMFSPFGETSAAKEVGKQLVSSFNR